jgi:hypothetical protein
MSLGDQYPAGPGGLGPSKIRLYLKLQGYFGYENDRTHVIKVVVLLVKITIQLTYGIHGFKKKEVM